MKVLNKLIISIMAIGLLIFAVLMFQKKSNKLNIGIIQIVEHDSLDKARNGFIDEMRSLGYDADFDIQIAGGDSANLNSIAQKFVSDKKDLIIAISTPAAQSVANATKDIPILATAVTDFKNSGLVDSNEKPGINLSGTSDLVPVKKQIELLKQLVPNCKKVGILYSSGEANSKFQADSAIKECEKIGISTKTITVSGSSEVQSVLECNTDVDAIFLPTDNLIASCMPVVSKISIDHKIPIICSFADAVNKGGLASYAMDYYELGKLTAHQADSILKKEAQIQNMPVEYLENTKLVINNEVAKKLGIIIPQELKGDLVWVLYYQLVPKGYCTQF